MEPVTSTALRALVVMGVAGCGKSSLAAPLAEALGWRFIEGDDHHSPEAWAKMRRGQSLSDADREPWLRQLGALLAGSGGAVLSCSALKRRYREGLRAAVPQLGFIYLALSPQQAQERVAARAAAGGHNFPATLVPSQFKTLEPPLDEPRVLCLDATLAPDELLARCREWLAGLSA